MRRIVGMDILRTFAKVVFWKEGRLRPAGRVDMTRSGLEGFDHLLTKEDEVVVEATGNSMAVVRILSPFVARVIIANPLEVKAIATPTSRPTRSTPACWPPCGPPTSCPRSGCPPPKPSGAAA